MTARRLSPMADLPITPRPPAASIRLVSERVRSASTAASGPIAASPILALIFSKVVVCLIVVAFGYAQDQFNHRPAAQLGKGSPRMQRHPDRRTVILLGRKDRTIVLPVEPCCFFGQIPQTRGARPHWRSVFGGHGPLQPCFLDH